ncbi:hypothetical protein [Pontibacter sp. G13]|uniref:DUF7619 domain-containing protein n=1 Tax=Pontibacter sp. G13 TaxID=3074898 RepID=UPI002889E8A2|nr:hypothetical protein [Pontibacter sp. G13]WNJ19711.1 hypothetical protein RJD25_04445 [Pontibacter sp. G13]
MNHVFNVRMLILLGCLVSTCLTSSAGNLMGREMWHEVISPTNWKVYLRTYQDCEVGVNAPISVAAVPSAPTIIARELGTTGWGAQQTLTNPSLESWTEVTALCPGSVSTCTDPTSAIVGIMEYIYAYDFDPTGFGTWFDFQVEECCRPVDLTNGVAGASLGIRNYVSFFSLLNGNNHSPQPRQVVHLTGCASSGGVFDLSSIDLDGDSLVYQLRGISGSSYGWNQLMGPNWDISIDAQTGILSVLPNGVGSPEKVALKVRVQEHYRDFDSTLSVTNRDVVIDMQACPSANALPTFGNITSTSGGLVGPDTFLATAGQPFDLTVEMSDPGDSPHLLESMFVDLPGATVTHTGTGPVNAHIQWNVPANYIDTTIAVYLTIQDGHCPHPASNAKVVYVQVENPISATVTPSSCSANTGAIDLTVNIPYASVIWSNNATTEDLTGLASGPYMVELFDAAGGLIWTQTYFVSSSDLTFSHTLIQPTCGQSDGQIDITITGGTAPYTVNWSNGGSGTTQSNLPDGDFVVQVVDANGCFSQELIELNMASGFCLNQMTGVLYLDMNGDCVYDAGDFPIPGHIVQRGTYHFDKTDMNGEFDFFTNVGTYTVKPTVAFPGNVSTACYPAGEVTHTFTGLGETVSNLHLPIEKDATFDISVDQEMATPFVPGLWQSNYLKVRTQGFPANNAVLTWVHDPVLQNVSFSPPATSYDPVSGTAIWNLGTINPYQIVELYAYGFVDTTAIMGDSVFHYVSVTPLVGDADVVNNLDTLKSVVLAAYDPNDKQSKEGEGPLGYIQQSERDLTYTIRFQNTGTFPAIRVILRDTLESNLPVESLYIRNYSHDFDIRVEDGNILVFTFNDIWLPDSASDPAGSIGFVKFGMKHSGALPYGTQLRNDAGIYFDFNEPIFTNEAVNTIASPTALPDPNWQDVRVAPNPFSESTRITFNNPDMKLNSLILWDMQGREVKRLPASRADYFELDRGNLSEGVYLFELRGETSYFGKVVIE